MEIEGFPLRPGVWLGKGSTVDPAAIVDGPAIIGDNCSVAAGVVLGEYTTLGSNVRIADNAEVRRSVVADNGYLGPGVRVAGAVIGRSCDLRHGARCEPGSVLGEGCLVGAQAEVRDGVKVYPFKTVEAGAIVNSSIVWESRGSRSLFGRDGVRGIANVDISPELAVRLSMAWASTLEKGTTITSSRDTSRAARVLKRAVMVGCNAAGVNVDDLEVATVPVTRHHIRTSASRGGVTVRLAPDDPESVMIRFFDGEGLDVAETAQRKIERLYHREDFRRVLAGEIGDIDFPARAVEQYTVDLVGAVDLSGTEAGLKLVLDLSYGSSSFVMPNLLSKLDADVLVVNPYANTPGMMSVERDAHAARVADLVRASGAQLGAVVDADGERLTIVDDEGTVLSDDQALLVLLRLVVRDPAGSPGGAAGGGRQRGRDHLRRCRRADHVHEALVRPPDGGGSQRRCRLRGQPVRGVHLAGLPAGLRRDRDAGRARRHARLDRPVAVEAGPVAAARPHRPRDGHDAVGAEGDGHADDRRAARRPRARADRRREGHRGRWLGARAARPRRSADPHLGGGPERGPGPGPGPAVRGSPSAELLRADPA